ncbi:MAG: glycosyltransferase N-terminal domain-containing protein [Rikenellaceae bacterium]
MRESISPSDRIVWIHAASLGEFEQGRPIIEKFRAESPEYKILLTFFSPSGYEIRKNYEGADYIFYLPIDTPWNARKFLDIAHPEIAIFVKYEYWFNLLATLRRRKIRSYIVSAIFRKESVFFKWWGVMWRRALESYETIFVQDNGSKELLATIGFDNVLVAGDTRFDRVMEIAHNAQSLPIIEEFRGEKEMFAAGSTWIDDEEILVPLIKQNQDLKWVIAPHEIDKAHVSVIEDLLTESNISYVKYSTINKESDSLQMEGATVMLLDTIGILSSLYQYAKWAYIGGGFGVGIHNTLEAATFSLPTAFGPNYERFKEAVDMVSLGASASVANGEELARWFEPLRNDKEIYTKASLKAGEYTKNKCGATNIIMRAIQGK